MFGFTGFYQFENTTTYSKEFCNDVLTEMANTLKHTEDETSSILLTDRFSLSQIGKGFCPPPFAITLGDRSCYIAIDGSIFNCNDLVQEFNISSGKENFTEETILSGFMKSGLDFIRKINGNFSIAIFDARHDTLYLIRDHFGTKPLFYTTYDGNLAFGSELKALMKFNKAPLTLLKDGLNEIFSIGPARTPGKAVFDGYYEVKPGHCIAVNRYGICDLSYWSLPCMPHTENYESTILHTKELLDKAISRELSIDSNPGCLLSGGIDSSLVAAYLSHSAQDNGRKLTTISFDFSQNNQFFRASSFQPSEDRPYVDMMVQHLHSEHHYLECNFQTLADMLSASMHAHDLPNMADIDSSLLYFCGEVEKINSTVYTGECADEVFGGYPWMHYDKPFSENNFPWASDLTPRKQLLKKEFLDFLNMDEYVTETYHKALRQIELRPEDSEQEANKRRYGALNLYWFMETLLNRMDRCGRSTGLTARIPFADKDLVSYIFNVPFDMKARNGLVKSLLRQTGEDMLPNAVLMRKKSPFPKTYHPAYEQTLASILRERITDTASPLHQFIDGNKLIPFLNRPKDYGAPWYGQLMCGPQMMAYLIQIDTWIRDYDIKIDFS